MSEDVNMDYPVKIPLPLQKRLYNQHLVMPIHFFVELHPEHFRWTCEFWANEPPVDDNGNPDRSLPWKETFNAFDEYYKRMDICAITLCFIENPDEEFWRVQIGVPGAWLKVFFKQRDKAQEVQKTLLNWWLREKQ
jgi:hypothetical protein